MTREEAINRLRDMIIEIRTYCDESKHMGEDDRQKMETFDMAIKALEQEPKTGHWIAEHNCWLRCSECGEHYPHVSIYETKGSNYCPNCGAKMSEVRE